MLARYGADVERAERASGAARSIRPAVAGARARQRGPFDLVAIVHAETSTGVRNPVADDRPPRARARRADDRRRGDVARRDAARDWRRGASTRAIRARRRDSARRPGSRRSRSRRARSSAACACRSFYFDLDLLEDYWLRRKYHHTISAPLVYALPTALAEVEEEGLEARWARHERVHHALVATLDAHGACRCCRRRPSASGA